MLDIPSEKSIVSFSDLAKFNVATFGADEVINHLREGGQAVAPTFPKDSIFLRKFKEIVMDESPEQSLDTSKESGEEPEADIFDEDGESD